jgi:ATP-dependent DNA helicase RecQ
MRTRTTTNAEFLAGVRNVPAALATMGFKGFRQGQDKVVTSIMGGFDTICILPTGTGKSACFVIPTLCMGWKTLVFSPLVALMRDQVQGLWKKDIAAGQLSGMQSDAENASVLKAWTSGQLDLIYAAPERLQNAQFRDAMQVVRPSQVVLDEAHTLSQWSDNFRPAYVKVGEYIAEMQPKVVSCFTATCPPSVEEDIRRVLGIPEAKLRMYYPRRENLDLRSRDYRGVASIAGAVREVDGSAIVYCSTIKHVEELACDLAGMLPDDQVVAFHGKLDPSRKRANQDDFMSGRARVVVATNAFGMGIDKDAIRAVIHRDMPGSLEALSQEVGRAGRDGLHSVCTAFYDPKSMETQEFFVRSGNPSRNDIRLFYNAIRTRADKNNDVKLTVAELTKAAGVDGIYGSALVSILAGAGVIERRDVEDRLVRVKMTPSGDDLRESGSNAKFNEVVALLEEGGVRGLHGYIEVDPGWVASRWGMAPSTLTKHLKTWDKENLIDLEPAFRGKVTRLTGGLELLDMDRLQRKAAEDYAKLDDVKGYFATPDAEKHAYIEKHFVVEGRS